MFVCHSWSLLNFFNKLSSYILRFTIAEISEIFAFMMAFAFLESLAITSALALVSALLPAAWLKNGFAMKSLMVMIVLAAASLGFQHFLPSGFPSKRFLLVSCVLPFIVIGIMFLMLRSYPRVQHLLSGIQDRLSIMIFIFGPIGFLSLVWIVTRYLLI